MSESGVLPMTEDEICEMYRTAKSKAKQVGILAELNATSKERIVEILEEYGYAVDGRAKRYLKKEERIAAAPSEPRNDKAGETEYPSTADAVPLPLGKGGSGEAASTHTHTHGADGGAGHGGPSAAGSGRDPQGEPGADRGGADDGNCVLTGLEHADRGGAAHADAGVKEDGMESENVIMVTPCEQCAALEVCKYKEDFAKACAKISAMQIWNGDRGISLKECPFLKITVQCPYFIMPRPGRAAGG